MQTDTQTPPPIVRSRDEWRAEISRLSANPKPSFFHLRARLPKAGATNQVVGASPVMNIVLKTYAKGGENELHAHAHEDHLFVVLQGAAVFYGPHNEEREVSKNDCVLLPAGSYYRFHAKEEGEPLVLLRVGAMVDAKKDFLARVDMDGNPFEGHSEKNRGVPLELFEDKWFG